MIKTGFILGMCLLVSACNETSFTQGVTPKSGNNGLSAEAIDPDLGGKCYPDAASPDYHCIKNTVYSDANNEEAKAVYSKKTYIALLVGDSQKKCDDFIKHLALAENNLSGNSGINNVATALGKAALPQMNALNAMANASGMTAGNDNEVSEAFARKNMNNYIQAINASYGIQIKQYMDTLENKEDTKINAAIEISHLRIIHAMCSLDAAQNFITRRLNNLETATPPPAATAVIPEMEKK